MAGNQQTNQVMDIQSIMPEIIKQAVLGISQTIPDIIDNHLAKRGVISSRQQAGSNHNYRSDDNDDQNRDSCSLPETRDNDAHKKLRDAGSQLKSRDIGSQLENRGTDAQPESSNSSHLINYNRKKNIQAGKIHHALIVSDEILSNIEDVMGIKTEKREAVADPEVRQKMWRRSIQSRVNEKAI